MEATTSSAVFYTTDRELVIKTVSADALRIWGKAQAEVVGRTVVNVFPFLEGSEILDAHRRALTTFRPVRM